MANQDHAVSTATKRAKEKMEQLLNVSLNIAVTGRTGSGKSSFVNVILGLSENDNGAAPTGVTETTTEPNMYEHPIMPNVKLWDLPGIGSPNFKAKKYLKDVQFETYDFFIILNSERFTENDKKLAKEIRKQKKSFYFVRSKIDIDIDSERWKYQFNEQEVLKKIREYCQSYLNEFKDIKVFLISSFGSDKYDFEKLQNTLTDDLPLHKRAALLQAWPVCSAATLEKKIKLFEGLTWAASLASAGITAVPVPGTSVACNAAIAFLFLSRCYYAFGLDDRSLKRLSEKVNIPLLEHRAKSKFSNAIIKKAVTTLHVCATVVTVSTIADLLSLLPGVGSACAAGLSFASTQCLLREGLKELANTAREIRKVAGLA